LNLTGLIDNVDIPNKLPKQTPVKSLYTSESMLNITLYVKSKLNEGRSIALFPELVVLNL